jgi:hypothetical protein
MQHVTNTRYHFHLEFTLHFVDHYRGNLYPQEQEVVLSGLPESGSKDPETSLFKIV